LDYRRALTKRKHDVLLLDCRHNMKLYCAHRIRVLRQRKAIDNILETMPENQAHVVLDFKMKFEAMYYHEKTLDFYEKKGLAWHGALEYVRRTEDEINVFAQTSKKVLHKFKTKYFDTISTDDTTQDSVAVLAHMEAVCRRIKQDTPQVIHVSLKSGNARCYKSSIFLYAAFIIAKQAGLKLVNFIHTGIQDGKRPIDGHFATAMRHILQCCNMGNTVVTPEDIFTALSANGGVNNSVAEMISLDRDTMVLFIKKHSHII
jgi:hypothetical protein